MTSRNWRRAVPAVLILGVLASGCTTTPSGPSADVVRASGTTGTTLASFDRAPRTTLVRARQTLAPAAPDRTRAATPSAVAAPGTLTSARETARPAAARAGARNDWQRPSHSLHVAPQKLLDRAHVPAAHPVRVVSVRTVDGKPTVSVTTSNDRAEAAQRITEAQQAPGAVAVSVDTRVHAVGTAQAATVSNDTLRSSQWALTRLQAEQVWGQQPGRGTIVAVVDSGVDASHPDLKGDVIPGADFVSGTGGNGFDDEHGHGTHVAGIIAATANNGIGVAGLAQGVKVMAVRVLDSTGSGWDSTIAQGIIYATDHGASVINLSLGGPGSDVSASAISYALAHGVVVVAAAGNERASGDPVTYPAAYPGVLGVAASDSSDATASFSNTGAYVDVTAPGVRVLSTYPGDRYAWMDGTSMATPYAAAAAALLKSGHPSLTPAEVDSALERTADDLGAPGRDDESGYGLIDPRAALQLCATTDCATASGQTPTLTQDPTSSTTPSPATQQPAPTGPAPTSPAPVTTPAPVATTTTVLSRPRTVRYGAHVGGVVQVRDETGAPVVGAPVQVCLQRAPADRAACRTMSTNRLGRARYAFVARAETTVLASYPGSETAQPSTAEPEVYPVAPRVAVRRHPHAVTVRVAAGHHQRLVLQRWRHGRWITTARARVAAHGQHVFRHLAAGRYRVRVPATDRLVGARRLLRLR